jgi:hypothetical protein
LLASPNHQDLSQQHLNSIADWSNSSSYKRRKKIGNRQFCQLTTLVNSTSTAPPIDLPPKGAEFRHTSNILFLGHQRRGALLRLYYNSSAVAVWECLTAGCKAFSLANGKGTGTKDWVIKSLDD